MRGPQIKCTLSKDLINFKIDSNNHSFKITLNKTRKVFLEDAQYYIEDVRKNVIDTLTYDKVYKQGFNINTPIDLNLQTIATKSLRDGLIAYDKRKGWRGPLTNRIYNSE